MKITIHIGKTPIKVTRKVARELFWELQEMDDQGLLIKPPLAIHTCLTLAESIVAANASLLGHAAYKTTIQRNPFLEIMQQGKVA